MSLLHEPISDIHKRLVAKEITPTDLVEESLTRIKKVDGKVQAFLMVDEEGARARAFELGERVKSGETLSTLSALPVGIKDNMATKGLPTTCGSKLLQNYEAIYDATVVQKLNAAHTITIGKTNMDEFAMGSSNENSGYYPVHNPWDLKRVPGGSSGGSAAAVAAGEVAFALGSDTGGSIRQPAAFCGVVGLKPTYGLVSRYGLVAFASSLDQIGPLTKDVRDSAYVLQAIAGHDAYDSTSANVEIPDYVSALTGEIKGLKIGVPKEMMGAGIDPGVKEKIEAAIRVLEGLGAVVEEVSLPHSDYAVATYYLLAPAEASSNLARYDGVRYGQRIEGENLLDLYHRTRSEGFGAEVKRRIMLGTYTLSSGYYDAYYLKAQKVRTLIRQDFESIFQDYDVILGPTTPTPAFMAGEKVDDPLTMYLNDICTVPVNLAGLPAMSLPCGRVDGLPIGLQLIGPAFSEANLLNTAYAYEQHGERLPKLDLEGGEA
ncbi:Asp-tRNA(Asn)/Glu-tRNA(Gln) amidotransferase subunit GatA [Mechercharimyces sp. CAU 1602]|uniref:Asp-tRNA(Asn)/Glu-tRNA(Gln) amidotransferase subunit GatA n=1 Tax=Mechercharimyces sp. CAU 1602 TaxID=2973933 RepID=UPI0021615F72|nr:Asp-tRNA(Asn)/Glu-tRNA(Gln) amidotransferase subunit GatA [Mechercharimyces sp. CAU 1602]MCS1352047.1 Asp-tRNA(Asn)/Glu-tRNA(Gln) amidotransferase subunit GatA [Mechercharimyces sp. CAU 1602]